MENLEQKIFDSMWLEHGFKHRVGCDFEENEFLLWIPVFNNEFLSLKPVPTLFYKSNVGLVGLSKEYSYVSQNRWVLKGLDCQEYQQEALAKLVHEMIHKWFSYYVDEDFYSGWFHGVPFRDLMKSFGITCNEWGKHVAITDPFRRLVREINPKDYRQF